MYGGSRFLLPRLEGDLIDTGVLIFTVLLCAVTGVAFGAIPALRLSDVAPSSAQGPIVARAWRPRHLQRWLTVGQLSLATLLLVGAGLFVHSFVRVANVDLGYDPKGALTFELVVPADVTNVRKLALAKELTARLQSIPQVRAAGFTGAAPLATITGGFVVASSPAASGSTFPTGRPPSQRAVMVSPGYLNVIGARLEEGRWLEPDDGFLQPPPTVINRSLARLFFGDRSPLGRSLRIGEIPWQVVGVIDDVRSQGLAIDPAPQAYVDPDRFNDAARQAGWDRFGFDATPAFLSFAVRVDGNPDSVVRDVRSIVRGLDSSAGVDGAIAMERVVAGELTRPRFYAALVTLLALLAAGLAAIGVYGVLSFLVALRTQEIGIRMALGAGTRDVVRLVIKDVGQLTAIGLALGLTGGAGLARYVSGLLFGIAPLDPTTFIGVSLIIILVAAFASWVPARRAAAVDPLTAIRSE